MMRKILIIFLLLVLTLNVNASGTRADCENISINVSNARLDEKSSMLKTFSIENKDSERFFIERINAFDYNSSIKVEGKGWERIVLPGDESFFNVQIKSFNVKKDQEIEGFVEVRGHFLSGTKCSIEDIGTQNFNVFVKNEDEAFAEEIELEQEKIEECKGFELIIPENVENVNEIPFTVKNITNDRIQVRLSGANLGIETKYFSIPAQTTVEKSVNVMPFEQKTWLVFNSNVNGCFVKSKNVQIFTDNPFEKPQTVAEQAPGFQITSQLGNAVGLITLGGFNAWNSIANFLGFSG